MLDAVIARVAASRFSWMAETQGSGRVDFRSFSLLVSGLREGRRSGDASLPRRKGG